jgi:PKD repeat protein
MLLAALVIAVPMLAGNPARAQDMGDSGNENNGMGPTPSPTPSPGGSDLPAMPRIPIRQPIQGSMMAAPSYGNSPLTVGFFVLATDPENIGFLTYQWNFGDGHVSSLPPELYIAHTYQNPGNYVCLLIVKTVDGRSATLFQGVVVKPAP